ncbi:MAG: redoxin domain-containing protein [Gemmatimonadota bacterium]|nr:redoxin domain-containing protein [Gemmatimonadota bacterium]
MFKYVLTLILLLLPACVHAAPTPSDCDFNNSGKVDFADFIAFSQGYGTTQTQFDLNGDGAVNFRDFVLFAQFYGQTITTTTPPPTTDAPVGIQVGMQAPDFTLRTLTGESFNLYEKRGKPVFLNFWATWCSPCIAEMPAMQKLQNTMGDSIQIVGIDVRETRSQVLHFVTGYGYTWTFVLDSTGEVNNAYEVTGYPTSYFIDAKGVIVRKLNGYQNYGTFLEATRLAIDN